MTTSTDTAPKEETQDFMVALPLSLHQALQDEAIRRGRAEGKRVHMTDIARAAIAKEVTKP